MKLVPFNINNYVRVQLTDVGRNAIKARTDELNEYLHARGVEKPLEHRKIEEDAEGWSRWQAWELFQNVGRCLGNGMSVPMYTEIMIEVDD